MGVRASLRRDFDGIHDLSRPASGAVPKNTSSVSSLALQRVNAIKERDLGAVAKAEALKRVHAVEETAALSLAGGILGKIDMV